MRSRQRLYYMYITFVFTIDPFAREPAVFSFLVANPYQSSLYKY
jgi:hypothetical protein